MWWALTHPCTEALAAHRFVHQAVHHRLAGLATEHART